MLFLQSKKVSFLSRTLLNLVSRLILTEKKNNEKIGIFEQKHGLTSLEKCDFWNFEKIYFPSKKSLFIILF